MSKKNMAKKAKETKQKLFFNINTDEVIGKVKEGTKTIKNTTQIANDFALETTEEVLDVALATGAKWQAVSEKAIKGGFKLTAKNNDIMFDLLGTAKEQLQENTQRVKELFFAK